MAVGDKTAVWIVSMENADGAIGEVFVPFGGFEDFTLRDVIVNELAIMTQRYGEGASLHASSYGTVEEVETPSQLIEDVGDEARDMVFITESSRIQIEVGVDYDETTFELGLGEGGVGEALDLLSDKQNIYAEIPAKIAEILAQQPSA